MMANSNKTNSKPVVYIPNLFKGTKGNSKGLTHDTKFISSSSFQKFSSFLSKDEDSIPQYLKETELPEKLPIPQDVLDKIWQVQENRMEENLNEEKKRMECQDEIELKNKCLKKSLDLKVLNVFKKHRVFFRKHCPVAFRFKSQLTHAEHEAYLFGLLKFNFRPPTAVEAEQHQNYLSLQSKVYEEQTKLIQFSEQVAQIQIDSYNTVPKCINHYITAHVLHRYERIQQYPHMYSSEQKLPLRPQDNQNRFENISFKHIGHLLSLGEIPLFKIPVFDKFKTVIKNDDGVEKSSPPEVDNLHDSSNYIYKTPVSQDTNAEYLARQHNVDIVISSSAMKIITCNVDARFEKNWDIPVTIKSCMTKDTDGNSISKRIVFIDKPFVKKTWDPLEQKQLFYKKSIISQFKLPLSLGSFRMNEPKIFQYTTPADSGQYTHRDPFQDITTYDDDIFDLSISDSCDTFGSEYTVLVPTNLMSKRKDTQTNSNSNKKQKNEDKSLENIVPESKKCLDISQNNNMESSNIPQTSKQNSSDMNTNLNSVDDDTPKGLLDNILDEQEHLLHSSQDNHTDFPDSSPKDKKKQSRRPWSNSLHTSFELHDKPKSCPPNSGVNFHYHLFTFETNNTASNQKFHDYTSVIRVLVRSSIHGATRPSKKTKKKKNTDIDESWLGYPSYEMSNAYIVFPKLENQAYFGCEVNTLLEITQHWIELLVRPYTNLLQVRISEDSGNVIIIEEKDINSVIKDGAQAHIGFHPQIPLTTLFVIFSSLKQQTSGNYLLHHDERTGAFVDLMKEVTIDEKYHQNCLHLQQLYTRQELHFKQFKKSPWIHIDTHLLTPFHIKHKKIPATFPMPYLTNNPKSKKKMKMILASKKMYSDFTS